MTTPDGIDALEQMVERLTTENATLRRCGEDMSAGLGKLEADNSRLRSEVEYLTPWKRDAEQLRRDLDSATADLARVESESAREITRLGIELGEAKHVASDLRLDLARLTHDAAAECGRLRAERDGLLETAAAEVLGLLELRRECGAEENETLPAFVRRLRAERDALLEANAAVSDTTKPSVKP